MHVSRLFAMCVQPHGVAEREDNPAYATGQRIALRPNEHRKLESQIERRNIRILRSPVSLETSTVAIAVSVDRGEAAQKSGNTAAWAGLALGATLCCAAEVDAKPGSSVLMPAATKKSR